jgi:ParB family transcriptional regulator, chromosome partitioning protein
VSLKNLKSKSDAALANIPEVKTQEQQSTRPTTAPGATAFMQPAMDALNERAKRAEAKVAEYEMKLAKQPTEVALNMLVEVPGRKRKLTPQQFEELKENLRRNPLVHPATVKKLPHGKFEIVSGHNRVEAFRALGLSTIPAVVMDIDEAIVSRSAFYANLFQTSLTDYEKYLGFREERDRTQETQKQIADEAGIPESVVSMLFSFERLPKRALELIMRRPEVIGLNCVSELAKLAREGKEERVIEAVELLVEGTLTQKEAVKHAKKVVVLPRSSVVGTPVKIRAGRLEFCEYLSRGASLRIEFKNEEHRQEAESAIANTLQELADGFKLK